MCEPFNFVTDSDADNFAGSRVSLLQHCANIIHAWSKHPCSGFAGGVVDSLAQFASHIGLHSEIEKQTVKKALPYIQGSEE